MNFGGNWLDLVMIVLLLIWAIEGWQQGLWFGLLRLASFLGSLVGALRFYPTIAKFLVDNFSVSYAVANALGFLFLALFLETILEALLSWFLKKIPRGLFYGWWTKILGVAASVLNGLVLLAFVLTLILALPVLPWVKRDITSSRIGSLLVRETSGIESSLNNVFGGVVEKTINFLTVKPQSQERVNLNFKIQNLTVDGDSETQMFALVNQERSKRGLKELAWNNRLAEVSRNYAKEMFSRGYFSHYSPEGEDVGDRLNKAGLDYQVAGENLAYAPSLSVAFEGLMNSPGHRANILSAEFHQIGIGVIDGGIYGKMFTQVFTN